MARARFVCLALLFAAAAPLSAQGFASTAPSVPLAPTASATTTVDASTPVGPAVAAQRTAAHVAQSNAPLQAMPERAGLGPARAMMVVGAAALVTGAIIGGTPGTIIMVGGGVVGLIGLWDYLQ